MSASCRRMTRHAGVARHKGNARKNRTRYGVEQGARKGQMFGKRHHMKPKGSHGVKNRYVKEQLHLRSERTSSRIFGKMIWLEIAKQIASLCQDVENEGLDIVEGLAPSKTEKETTR